MQGNAAHLMTNFQQLGPSQQIEDAMILGTLLRLAHSRTDLEAALKAYDTVRRPRAQWVSDHGKRLGYLWMGLDEGVGLDVEKLRDALLKWKEDSEAFDLVKHRDEAIRIMKEGVKVGSKAKSVSEDSYVVMGNEEKIKVGVKSLFDGVVGTKADTDTQDEL